MYSLIFLLTMFGIHSNKEISLFYFLYSDCDAGSVRLYELEVSSGDQYQDHSCSGWIIVVLILLIIYR
jgi:hypothetical protein